MWDARSAYGAIFGVSCTLSLKEYLRFQSSIKGICGQRDAVGWFELSRWLVEIKIPPEKVRDYGNLFLDDNV